MWRGEPPPPSRGQKGPFLGVFAKTPKMPIFAIFAHFCADRKIPEISAPPPGPRAPARGGAPRGGPPGGPGGGFLGVQKGVKKGSFLALKMTPKIGLFWPFSKPFSYRKYPFLGVKNRVFLGGILDPPDIAIFVPANFVPKTQKIPKKKCPMFVPNGRFIKYPTKCAKFCPAGGPGVSRGGPGG